MKYYLYRPAANNFAGIGAATADNDLVTNVHYIDDPLLPLWESVTFHGFDDEYPLEEGDFPSLSNYYCIPVMSQRAWNILHSLIGYCCEALPIIHPTGDPFYIVHVMETIDCLDERRSKLSRSKIDGRVNRIYEYAFKTNLLHGKHIFKLPVESGADLLVDDVFRQAVEGNGLKGLLFHELSMSH